MKIAITSESTNDLPVSIRESIDLKVIPFDVILDTDVFKDGEISNEQLFEFVAQKNILPKTTALNQFAYEEFFSEIRKEYDAVIHFALSSGLTSSCNNAINASKNLDQVYVVDTLSLSAGIGLLCMEARKLADSGLLAKEVFDIIEQRKYDLVTTFVVEQLDYLYKGGRCNSLQLLGANLLKFRPQLVLKDGKIVSDKKYRGRMGRVLTEYCRDLFLSNPDVDLENAIIVYSSATDEMLDAVNIACKEKGFKNVYHSTAGATVASHCGANTLGVMFFNKRA